MGKEIGLVLNFEAELGTKLYVNGNQQGNAALVKSLLLQKRLPVSNSLMYSIYKMLPNDTDLRVKAIQGYNFAL
jgi:hypothetical protein